MAHVQRREDMLLDVVGVGFPAGCLDDQAEDVEIQVAVLELSADWAANLKRGQVTHLTLNFVRMIIEIGQANHAGQLWQAAGLVEQVAQRDLGGCLRIGNAEPGQVVLHGRIQFNLPVLDKLHDRQGGEGLGQ